ncbi:MAG: cell envelope biogenesis protein OmpA [Crocinitomicaceae bacterium]|nr:cell envelope biogenesis protein OmpA [Crocinitomicaceae bacterium]|tara:strand:- start:5265 stop:6323 length:1059 start_codon:yes stop_codon:yes gene_type:complete
MMILFRNLSMVLACLWLITSCVPQRKYAELENNYEKSEEERNYLSGAVKDLEVEKKELAGRAEKVQSDYEKLDNDYKDIKEDYDYLKDDYRKLTEFKNQLMQHMAKSAVTSKEENQKLLRKMIEAQEDLQRKEDALKQKETELRKLEQELNGTKKNLDELDIALKKREKRINELEAMIAEKDAAAKALRDKIANALLNFKDKGLTVTQKNGRIYVSMEAKLLFPSGSTTINSEGKKALVELSKVLESQNDITILVEGHTDTDKMKGTGCIKDNWELSVMRATAVVKLMMSSSKIDPATLTAAGRSEYIPVDETDKSKNRRIEIILTPNLDKLFEILDEGSSTENSDSPSAPE